MIAREAEGTPVPVIGRLAVSVPDAETLSKVDSAPTAVGLKLTVNVHVFVAASVRPEHRSFLTTKSESPAERLKEPVVPPPVLATVKVAAGPACPTVTLPRLAGPAIVSAGPPVAVPVRAAVIAVAPVVTLREAVLAPAAMGLNATWMEQVVSATRGRMHLLSVIVNSVALAPVSAAVRVPDVALPELPTLKTTEALVAPTFAVKAAEVGVIAKLAGETTVGVTGSVRVTPAALHTTLSDLRPDAADSNVNP